MKVNARHIFLLFLSFYLLTFSIGGAYTYFYSIDGKVEYEQTVDIARGDLSLLISPRKHLGISLFQLPFYKTGEIGERIFGIPINPTFTLMANSFITASGCLLLFLVLLELSTQRTAVIITLIYGFATLAWPYAKHDTADPLLATSLLGVFWTLVKYGKNADGHWFVVSLFFMFVAYVSKLVSHAFIASWMLYVFLVDGQNREPLKSTTIRAVMMLVVWALVLPVSLNVNASSPAYTWAWFKDIGHKIMVREFSPFDGLFIYTPVALFIVFSLRRFVIRFRNEFFLIALLLIPYNIVLHLGVDYFCLSDFAGRYDLITIPFLLIMLVPFIEDFNRYSGSIRTAFITVLIVQFVTQVLGSCINILYYANMIEGSGLPWKDYVLTWRYSPFGAYPVQLLKILTGVEIPIPGLNNLSPSVLSAQTADFLWMRDPGSTVVLLDLTLLIVFVFLGIHIVRRSGLVEQLKRHSTMIVGAACVVIVAWTALLVPRELPLKTRRMPVSLVNPGFETFRGNPPEGWHLIDWSKGGGNASVTLIPCRDDHSEGLQSLAMQFNQDYVTISLASTGIEVREGELLSARCAVKDNKAGPASMRIAFINVRGDVVYWSATTRVRAGKGAWRELNSTVMAPPGAVRAEIWLNIWAGGLKRGDQVLFDDVRVEKRI